MQETGYCVHNIVAAKAFSFRMQNCQMKTTRIIRCITFSSGFWALRLCACVRLDFCLCDSCIFAQTNRNPCVRTPICFLFAIRLHKCEYGSDLYHFKGKFAIPNTPYFFLVFAQYLNLICTRKLWDKLPLRRPWVFFISTNGFCTSSPCLAFANVGSAEVIRSRVRISVVNRGIRDYPY